ncbi:hypothetical protein Salmuc_01955 [Salipiger mucosus DSM 16094]|uniref:Uncharacterized protein n=1 Tax=Salipiger mucosus DSM 16094 TaxID=1123237 RepID=S9Q848_9RHOB|nr:hypothetical protein Salmuc_01955 [Salipiger mucosus DSM 16094]
MPDNSSIGRSLGACPAPPRHRLAALRPRQHSRHPRAPGAAPAFRGSDFHWDCAGERSRRALPGFWIVATGTATGCRPKRC